VPEVPQKFQTMAVLQIVAGVCNMFFGWWIGMVLWSTFGTVCTGVMTLGLCPFGMFCGMLSLAIVPIGMVELLVGILMLASPQTVKGFVAWLPLLQIPMIFLGDLISPVLGIASFAIGRDPEVVGFIEGM
jgi:hypothetical protein